MNDEAISININDLVTVTLTGIGAITWNEYHERLIPGEFVPKAAGDVCEFQIWRLMQIFGPQTFNGMEPHFEGNMLRSLRRFA